MKAAKDGGWLPEKAITWSEGGHVQSHALISGRRREAGEFNCSVTQSCPTLCSLTDCSTPGFLVLHYLPGIAQTHVYGVGDAILCHPLLLLPSIFPSVRIFPSEPALRIKWPNTGASASASVLPMNIQGWFPLGWTGLISLQSKGLSRVFSSTTVRKHQFLSAQPSLWSNSHLRDYWKNHSFHCLDFCWQSDVSAF